MKCPKCGCIESRVLDSRPYDDYMTIRRRRECLDCKHRFTTYERIVSTTIPVVKRDATREEYDRSKILRGILKACEKRSVTMEQMENMVSEIETELFSTNQAEIQSTEIGELVMNKLRDTDEVAYVRFASVYRQFKDISTFMSELEKIIKEQRRSDD